MKTSRILAPALAALVMVTGASARAQVTTAPPIVVKVKTPKPKQDRFKGEVLHADALSIIVRDRKDPRFIRTFTYTPKVKDKMDKIFARGGYQYGDKVQIRYEAGKDVALAISGKPSKPL
jgi:hypothetical protein